VWQGKIRKAAATIETDKNALGFYQSLSTFICREYCLDAEIDTLSTTLKSSNYHSLLNKVLALYTLKMGMAAINVHSSKNTYNFRYVSE